MYAVPLLSWFLGLFPVEIYDISKLCLSLTSSFMWIMYFGLQGSFCHLRLHFVWWIIHISIFEEILFYLVRMTFLTCGFFWELWLQQTFLWTVLIIYMNVFTCNTSVRACYCNCYLLAHGTVERNQSGAETGLCFNCSGLNTILGVIGSQKQPVWLSLCEPFAKSNLSFLSPWLISVVFFCRKLHCVLAL